MKAVANVRRVGARFKKLKNSTFLTLSYRRAGRNMYNCLQGNGDSSKPENSERQFSPGSV